MSLFLFLNVNPAPAQGTSSLAVDSRTVHLPFDAVLSYVHSQISLARVSVETTPLSICGSSPWLPHSSCLVVAGLCNRAPSTAAAIPPASPGLVLSALLASPSRLPDGSTATHGTLVDTVLHHGTFYWTHSPFPKLGTVGFLGRLRNGPAPQKAQPPSYEALIKALPGRGDVVKPRFIHFLPSQSLGCQGPHSLTYSLSPHTYRRSPLIPGSGPRSTGMRA